MTRKYVKILSVLLCCLLVQNLFYGILPIPVHASTELTQTSTNLIQNGSFETVANSSASGWTDYQASGWYIWKAQGTCTVTVDNTVYHDGSKSLKISSSDPTGKWPVIQDRIPVTAGKYYKLSGWIKTKDIANVVYYRIYFTSGSNQIPNAYIDFGKLSGTNEWTYVEKDFKAIDGADGIQLYNYFLNGTGTAWFDGLVLEETNNLLTNGGYEQVTAGSSNGWTNYRADGWNVWNAQGKAETTVESAVYKEGSKSLRIRTVDENARTAVGQYDIPVKPGKYYKLSQWIKTENMTGGACMRIQLYDSNNVKVDMQITDILKQTNDWTLVQKVVQIPENATKYIAENYCDYGTGTAWFDGAVLEEVDGLLINGGYEQVTAGSSNGWTNYRADGWSVWNAQGKAETTVESAVYKEGSKSLRICSVDDSTRTVIGQYNIPVKPGKYYKLSQWIKTENITGGAVMRIQLYDSNNVQVQLTYTDSLLQTKDWTLVEKVFQVPGNVIKCHIEDYYYGTGTAWYDGAVLKEVIPVTGVSLDKSYASIAIGETLQLNASILPSNATDKNITWSSSNTDAATVTNGEVKGLGVGAALITADTADENVKASCIVVVNGQQTDITSTNYTVLTDEDTPVRGAVIATDAANHPLVYSKLTNSSYGWSQVDENGNWTYTPGKDYNGTDSFIVFIEDGNESVAVSSVNITVNPVNDAPAPGDIIVGVVQGTSVSGKVSTFDTDNDSIAYAISSNPSKGTVTLTPAGDFTYTANGDSTGEDCFVVTASDNIGGSSLYTVNVFIAPQGQKIINTLKTVSAGKMHPRINAGKQTFDNLKSLLEANEEYITKWFNDVKAASDAILTQPPKEYVIPDGLRLLEVSREVLRRTRYLSMTYLLTGDSKYAERLWVELDKAGNFQDWNSSKHFLDTAEMTNAFGIAYDWLYDYWSPERKGFIVKAIKEKGLLPGINAYNTNEWWTKGYNNWNGVCNGGLAVGALAVGDETDIDPAIEGIAATILENAVKGLPYMLQEYKPDGAWYEGPAYWDYGTSYTVYMLSSMFQALGTDYGLSELPCMDITTNFPIYNNVATGSYNFADAGIGIVKSPIMLWFGTRYNNPSYYWTYRVSGTDTGDPMSMLWYPGYEKYSSDAPPQMLDKKFGYAEVGTMRSGWYNSSDTFLGFKGGYNQFPHGDLDEGSFVYDAYGIRWAMDLGGGDYNAPGYWDMGVLGGRWTYYRKRAEGHNTFVINPGNYPDQNVYAKAKIEKFETNSNQTAAMSIVDLSETYNKDAFSARRGLSLTNNKTELLVQDEVRNKKPSDYWWFMHTNSSVEISPDGKSAILNNQGKRLYVQILSDEGKFSVMDAVPLPTSPIAVQQPNPTIRKLVVHIENALDVNLAVRMVPLMSVDEIPADKPAIVCLDDWKVKEESPLFVDGLSVAGTEVQNFNKNNRMYRVTLPYGSTSVPTIEARVSNPDINVDVMLPEAIPGIAKITVTSKTNIGIKNSYYVEVVPNKGITASTAEEGNWPENSMDGDLITRWAAEGDQWIQYYIGEEQVAEAISIAYFRGNERKYIFDVLVSEDGEHWKNILSGVQTSGTTSDLVRYDFPEMEKAKYVRIFGHGSNVNRWNNIAEVNIHKLSIYDPRYDNEAPVITQCGPLTIKQTVQAEVYFTISDNKSGVKFSNITLDGVKTTEDILIEPLSMKLGVHTIKVEAGDNAGNTMEKAYQLEITLEETDLITMVNLGYGKGYITDEGIYNSLIAKLKQDRQAEQGEKSNLNRLMALKNEIEAQKGKKIDQAYADILIEAIDYVVGYNGGVQE